MLQHVGNQPAGTSKGFVATKFPTPMINSAPVALYCCKVAAIMRSTMSRLRWRTLATSIATEPVIIAASIREKIVNTVIRLLNKGGLLQSDIDYHLIRASMVLIFLAFGYQKWFEYEAQVLIPYISNGPLIFWMYPVFGIRGASWFLGVTEWLICALLFLGFWNKRLGILGAPEFRREVQRLSALNLLDFPFPGAAFASPKSSGRRRRRKENLAFPW